MQSCDVELGDGIHTYGAERDADSSRHISCAMYEARPEADALVRVSLCHCMLSIALTLEVS